MLWVLNKSIYFNPQRILLVAVTQSFHVSFRFWRRLYCASVCVSSTPSTRPFSISYIQCLDNLWSWLFIIVAKSDWIFPWVTASPQGSKPAPAGPRVSSFFREQSWWTKSSTHCSMCLEWEMRHQAPRRQATPVVQWLRTVREGSDRGERKNSAYASGREKSPSSLNPIWKKNK